MSKRTLADEYLSGLRAYVANPGELTLALATKLGRSALDDGASLADVVGAHGEALRSLLAGRPQDEVLSRATVFLAECLARLDLDHREAIEVLCRESARLQLQVAEANAELEAFTYSVSHDLRAPLRAIDGFSESVLENSAPMLDETGRHGLERVRANATRMGQLIDEMLQLSRLSRRPLTVRRTDLSALATEVVAGLREQQPERTVDVRIADRLAADADPDLLRIALTNLFGNAWKFTAKQAAPRVEFGCDVEDGGYVYFVRDNGVGFDMAHADRLFRPFERLHTEADFPGIGVGLATVLRVIHRHGGRIWAEAAVGQGATFFFTLPPVHPSIDLP